MDQLEAYSKLHFTPSLGDLEEYNSSSTRSNDKSSDDEDEEQVMAATYDGNYEEGSEVPVNEGNYNDDVNRNDEPTVQIDETSGKYLNKILKVTHDEFKMLKTARGAFSATIDYPMNILEDWFRRLDKYFSLGRFVFFW